MAQRQRGATDTTADGAAADARGTDVQGDEKNRNLKDDKEYGVEVRSFFVYSYYSLELNMDTSEPIHPNLTKTILSHHDRPNVVMKQGEGSMNVINMCNLKINTRTQLTPRR